MAAASFDVWHSPVAPAPGFSHLHCSFPIPPGVSPEKLCSSCFAGPLESLVQMSNIGLVVVIFRSWSSGPCNSLLGALRVWVAYLCRLDQKLGGFRLQPADRHTDTDIPPSLGLNDTTWGG